MARPALKPVFETEAALCDAFIRTVPDEWVVYPETAGWDMVLVHRVGGWQIGVEAKKVLNAKVLSQALSRVRTQRGPDFRAVLVERVVAENAVLAKALGLTVITVDSASQWTGPKAKPFWRAQGPEFPTFHPALPEARHLEKIGDWWSDWDREPWFDYCPIEREILPDYVPQVAAGVPAPMVLSDWKIKAMRVCVWVEKNQVITRKQFKALGIDPSRWMNGYWLTATKTRGVWKAGSHFPGKKYRSEHPEIWEKIVADYGVWSAKVPAAPEGIQEALAL